jgi:hypothetical protein
VFGLYALALPELIEAAVRSLARTALVLDVVLTFLDAPPSAHTKLPGAGMW